MTATPVTIHGQRIVRLREIRTSMPPFVLVTWGVFDIHGRKALHKSATRAACAAWVTARGWRYIGSQVTA